MAISAEEEETLDAIKRWWNESGKFIATGIAAIALCYFAWQFWIGSRASALAEASALYDQLANIAVVEPGQQVSSTERERAMQIVAELKSQHDGTIYALYGALFGARLAVEDDNLTLARQELEWLLANARDGLFNKTEPTLLALARLRLARVLLADGQATEALTVISAAQQGALAAEFEELRGDIYLSQGQSELALAAYQAAVQTTLSPASAQANGISPVLQLKLNELQGSR